MPKIDYGSINWHKVFKTDEYLKKMRLINQKQLALAHQLQKKQKQEKKLGNGPRPTQYT